MADSPDSSPSSPAAWLQHGQKLEAETRLNEAIAAYDRVIAGFAGESPPLDVARGQLLGLAWMSRGNALQKLEASSHLEDAVRAYDEAIAIFQVLPLDAEPTFRVHLGAAWLNRGHALILANDPSSASSFERAIAAFEQLPPNDDPYVRLNVAGAWTNLAHARLDSTPGDARVAARRALEILVDVESAHEAFAAMSLRARRALVLALGEILRQAEAARQSVAELASEATDAIDEGLALARTFENAGASQLRPLAARLFRMGAHLYRVHQPHFLAEYILESFDVPGYAADDEFRAVATASLEAALADLQRPQLFVAGVRDAERKIETARSLRAAQQRLALAPSPAPANRPDETG